MEKNKQDMSNITVEEGNKLIAEFVGVICTDKSLVNYPKPNKQWSIKFPNGQEFNEYGELGEILSKYCKYHTSWDWLMPVVEKIEFEIGATITSRKMICEISYREGENSYSDIQEEKKPINALWLVVVQFIKWYNTQTP